MSSHAAAGRESDKVLMCRVFAELRGSGLHSALVSLFNFDFIVLAESGYRNR